MNPRAAAMILVVVLVVTALLVWLIVWFLSRQAGVRRAEFKRMRAERDLLAKAVLAIEEKTDTYRDLESVLAADIRSIVRKLDNDRMEITR